MRILFASAGLFFVTLGVAGAFLPVLPTTPFIILAAACFARSSPRLEAWLLSHRVFGPMLRDWRERGAIPRRAKTVAVIGCALGYVLFWVGTQPSAMPAMAVAVLMLTGLAYVFSRPS
ncbi:MAG: YbaN family protein [Hyphomicrobium sp.]|uniref:YbaN family protein n=1 Tax=Hyphomicrobium sp. TaxID=82 RepID=UPI003563F202